MTYARITGSGAYLPENVVTNKDLEKTMDTSDEWIQERTGIKRRHIAAAGETLCGSVGGVSGCICAISAHMASCIFWSMLRTITPR